MEKLSDIKNRIKEALKNANEYSESMDMLIEITAGNMRAYQIALADIENIENSYVSETTRENNVKLSPHPAFKILIEESEMIRKCLRELRLTLSTAVGGDGDELDEMIKTVNDTK